MKVYCISGIGADGRIFDTLQIEAEKIIVHWEPTTSAESLGDYAKKLARQIDANHAFILLGVSYGGMLAIEMNKFIKPEKTILISSVARHLELPLWVRWIGKTGIINLVPDFMFTIPSGLLMWYFGIKDELAKQRISGILENIDREFTKASIRKLLKWQNDFLPENLIRIHGNIDRLLPVPKNAAYHPIGNGGHFMIVQNAKKVSELVNRVLES